MKKLGLLFLLLFLLSVLSINSFAANDFTAPKIISKSPLINVNANPVILSVETDEIASCRYDLSDISFTSMSSFFIANLSSYHKKELFLSEGPYAYYVRCMDIENNSMLYSELINFSFDVKPPVIVDTPVYFESHTDNYVLSVKTNEPATCKISNVNTSYSNMYLFTYTGKENVSGLIEHKHLIPGLQLGYNQFSVKCNDIAGNVMGVPFSFQINNLGYLSTDILLESDVLVAGIHKVVVKTNVPLKEKPVLSYSYDNLNFKDLVVNGKGADWFAYIEIETTAGIKKGSFRFKGTDIYGFETSYINTGSFFSVDTIVPAKLNEFTISRDDKGKVLLSWNKKDTDIRYYEIYKSENLTVSLLDEEASITETNYVDASALPSITYYYTIRAIDFADNKGEFSDLLIAKPVDISLSLNQYKQNSDSSKQAEQNTQNLNQATAEVPQESLSTPILKNVIEEFDLLKVEILETSNKVEKKKDDLQSKLSLGIIEKLDLIKNINEIKTGINNIFKEMDELDKSQLNTVDLKIKIESYKERKNNLLKSIPENVELITSKILDSTLQIADDKIIDSLLQKITLYEANKKIKQSINENKDKLSFTTELQEIDISFPDGSKKKKLLVTKEFNLKNFEKIKTYYLIESIPKGILNNITNSINQNLQDFKILEEDPVIQYKIRFDTEKAVISYTLDGVSPLVSENEFITLVTEIPFLKKKTANPTATVKNEEDSFGDYITGFSVKSGKIFDKDITFADIIVYIGLAMIIGLICYTTIYRTSNRKNNTIIIAQNKNTDKKSKINTLLETEKLNLQQINEESGLKSMFSKVSSKLSSTSKNELPNTAQEFSDSLKNKEMTMEEMPAYNELFKVLECDSLLSSNQYYSKLGLKTLNNIHLITLLDEAHQAINNLDFEKANNIYNMLLSTHGKHMHKLNQEDNVKFKNGLNTLCLKLHVYMNLGYSHVVVKKNDTHSLRNYLNKIADDFNKLSRRQEFNEHNTKLLKYVSYYHTKYADLLVSQEPVKK